MGAANSITVAGLQDWLSSSDAPVLIDLRSEAEYAESRLPNAIHIPWHAVDSRRLPPLGDVVVYDSGLGRENLNSALAALETKPGITVWYLEGGISAWETRSGILAERGGVKRDRDPLITYREVVQTLPADAVLVDLREPSGSLVPASEDPVRIFAANLKRPLVSSVPSNLKGSENLSPAADSTPPLYVLIGEDTEKMSETARRMRDQGYERVVILAGGVEIIQTGGQSGLKRTATSITLEGNNDE